MANDFSNKVTQVNTNNNEGLENVGNLKNNLENIGKLLGRARGEFEKFDISNDTNKDDIESISGQNESGKAIVDMMASVRDSSDKDLSEQITARKMLADIKDRIEKSNTLSVDQKALLSAQAQILESGFKKSNLAFEQAKKSIAEYSDVAVAGVTSIMGNSPLTMFMSKMVVDQTKAFFQRKKDVKANMAKLEKAEAIDNMVLENSTENTENTTKTLTENEDQTGMMKWSKRFAKIKFMWEFAKGKKPQLVNVVNPAGSGASGSMATQVKEENRREGLKKKLGAKFKNATKDSKSPFVRMLLLAGKALLFLLKPLRLLTMGFGLAATLIKTMSGGISSLVGKIFSFLPSNDPTQKPTKKAKAKPTKSPKKGGKLNGLKNLAKGASRFLGPAGAVAGAGAAGYAAGSYINDTFLTNEDGSGKIANLFGESDEEIKSKSDVKADKMAQSKGFKNFKELKAHNVEVAKAKDAAAKQVASSQVSVKETDTSSKMSSVVSDHTSQIKELRSQQVNAITSSRADLAEKERETNQSKEQKPSNVAVNSTTNNNATTIVPPQRPINVEKNFIAASMNGAL